MLAIAMQTELLLKHADMENWPAEKLDSLLQKRQELILAIDKYKRRSKTPAQVGQDAIIKLIAAIQAQDMANQQRLQAIKAETATKIGSIRRNNQAIKAYNPMPYDNNTYFMDKKR
jgi:hypothetical protein